MNYWTASHWLSFSVSAVIIAVLAAVLLDALADMEERTEKLMVEITLRNMRTGLQLAMGEAMLHGRDSEIAGWAGTNPLQWLGREPEGYLGMCSSREMEELAEGKWCFDRERGELAYRPRYARHLHLLAQKDSAPKVLRWRVTATQPAAAGLGTGLRIENATIFEWFSK